MPAAPVPPHTSTSTSAWTRWLHRPRSTAFRRLIFQLHLWSGVALGLYIFFISITGSVLVYRNELYVLATPDGRVVRWAFNAVTTLIELHKNLLAGSTGLVINGIAAALVIFVLLTGLVLWWPGIAQWKQGLVLRREVPWQRLVWDLHRVLGFWTFAAMFVFALSGIYLCFGSAFHTFADWLQPAAVSDDGSRFVDTLLYWLAFLHFGRINGIGLFCDEPGVCDQAVKATWALFGLAPALMFITGTIVWWNRVLRPRWRRRKR
jgi:uncharacterized iron-regulated membrane protein